MVINNEWERLFFFEGSNSGLLCKMLPLTAVNKVVQFEGNIVNLRRCAYRENLV